MQNFALENYHCIYGNMHILFCITFLVIEVTYAVNANVKQYEEILVLREVIQKEITFAKGDNLPWFGHLQIKTIVYKYF